MTFLGKQVFVGISMLP